MQSNVRNAQLLTIKIQADEILEALEFCSLGRYEITRMVAERDGRSGNYTGVITIEAVKRG